jgi:hypothetical protein
MWKLIPLRRQLYEIVKQMDLQGETNIVMKSTVFEDNNDFIATAEAVKMTHRTKHIAVKYHFFKSHIGDGTGISLVKIDTNAQKRRTFSRKD